MAVVNTGKWYVRVNEKSTFISEFARTGEKERGEYVDIMSWKEIIKTVTILVVILLYNYNKESVGNDQNINRYRMDSHNLLFYPQQQLIRK